MQFSGDAARTWSKDHIREVLQSLERDLEVTRLDYERATDSHEKAVTQERIEEFESDRDFLEDLLG